MKRLLTASVLMLVATTTWAQAPADHETHHPAQTVTPAQPAPPPAAQSMMGRMPMGSMPMMRMMGATGSEGMVTIDHIEGWIAACRAQDHRCPDGRMECRC